MSFQKVAELADKFAIKYEDPTAPETDTNSVDEDAAVDEKTWNHAKKVVKKYFSHYDQPWAVVYDVYKKMHGKEKEKHKKKKKSK